MRNSILFKIAKREYLQTVKKKSFWLSTFALPIAILALSLVSGFSSSYAEQQITQSLSEQQIVIVDELNILNSKQIPPNILLKSNYLQAAKEVKSGKLYAAVLIPKDLVQGKEIQVTFKSSSVLDVLGLEPTITGLLKSAVITSLENPESRYILTSKLNINAIGLNAEGNPTGNGLANLVLPIAGIALYMILVTFSTSYLLRSVSEEKENRMIEIMLTNASAKQLVWGKVAGQIGIVFTQMFTLIALSLVALRVAGVSLPAELTASLSIAPAQAISILGFVLLGFLSMAGLMVMAASAVPTYREAQSFSTIFILIGILPIYLVTAILAQPNGSLANIASLIPLTSPLAMVMRLGVTNMELGYVIGIGILNGLYAFISFVIAFKVFELNAVEYGRSFSWRSLLHRQK